jgi:hypothetical protein
MKSNLFMISLLVAAPSFAANFGSTEPVKSTVGTGPVTKPTEVKLPPLPVGPAVTGLFRIVKPDGNTVIVQTPISVGGNAINVINVATTDAFLTSGGKCAFNVKYDEVSGVAATGTTNRLFSNDALIAQNTKIDLVANALKTIWTQSYLVPGVNNVKVVVNAESSKPSTGWVRVYVAGTCAAAPTTPPVTSKEPPKAEPPKTTPPKTEPPKTTVTPPVVPKFGPGTSEWNNFYIAFGYSNYGVTQLKGKGFARYADLVKLNADITVFVNAKLVDQTNYNALMTRWNSFVVDPAFKAAMAATVPGTDTRK